MKEVRKLLDTVFSLISPLVNQHSNSLKLTNLQALRALLQEREINSEQL
ncbi:hypothetical protein [Anabaena sp. CCY 0017]